MRVCVNTLDTLDLMRFAREPCFRVARDASERPLNENERRSNNAIFEIGFLCARYVSISFSLGNGFVRARVV